MTATLLALDAGSSWCKAVALDRSGRPIAIARVPSAVPEHDLDGSTAALEGLWDVTVGCLRELVSRTRGAEPLALGVTAAALPGLCVDRRGRPFALARGWQPPEALMAEVAAHAGWSPLGAACHGYAPRLVARLAWMRRHQPRWHAAIDRVGAMHSFLLWRLTGRWVTDAVSGPGIFDWPAALFDLGGVDQGSLPEIAPGEARAGALLPEVAAATGLPAGLPVAVGGHDGALASVGAGAWNVGDCCWTLATHWVPRTVSGPPLPASFGYPVRPERWAWADSVPSGLALDAVASALDVPRPQLERDASRLREAGAALPDLEPLRGASDPDAETARVAELKARGWSDGAIYLAAIRRSLDAVLANLDRTLAAGGRARHHVATGGFSQSRLVIDELAGRIGAPVRIAAGEASARAAAAYAGVAAGMFTSVEDAVPALTPEEDAK